MIGYVGGSSEGLIRAKGVNNGRGMDVISF